MFTISDIPAFREQIIANGHLIHRPNGGSRIVTDVVIQSVKESSNYIASLVDMTTGKVLLQGTPDANPAMATQHLFEASTGEVAKVLEVQENTEHEGHQQQQQGQLQGQQQGQQFQQQQRV